MRGSRPLGIRRWPLLAAIALWWAAAAQAQDLVPGAYTPAPVGVNVLTATAGVSRGGVAFDPSLPIEDLRATVTSGALVYNRTLDVAGRFASFAVGIPYLHGQFEGTLLGVEEERTRAGHGDLLGRIAINLYGAPAMTRQEFAAYSGRTNLGVSLVVTAPVGQYTASRYINIGTNRWSFKPEVGFSRRRGRWTFEGDAAVAFFTDNTNYVSGIRSQARIVALQGHVIYTFRPLLWLAADGNFWKGGRTTTNGVAAAVEQRNSRLGVTLAVPVQRQQLRVAYSFGAITRLGGDFHSVGVTYSYIWAAR